MPQALRDKSTKVEVSASRVVFDPEASRPAFERAARIAMRLFERSLASVVLVDEDGRIWRSADPNRRVSAGSEPADIVIETGELLWIENAAADDRFARHPLVLEAPFLRSFIGVPIKLEDGSTRGAFCIVSTQSHAFDEAKAGALRDLADVIAGEWAQAKASVQIEAALKEQRAIASNFSAVVKAMPVSLIITDRAFKLIECSPSWTADAGIEGSELVGKRLSDLAPALFDRLALPLKRALCGRSFSTRQMRCRGKDGSISWSAVEIAPWRSSDGSVAGVIIAIHDVTESVRALETAQRSEERLKLAMEIAEIHVWEMDYVGKELVQFGDEHILYDRRITYEELDADIYSSIDPRDRPAVLEQWRQYVEEGAPYRPEYRVTREDGAEVWANGSCRLIEDHAGNPVRLIGALQNITERKAAERALLLAKEEAEAASIAKSAFLATMSHEIRTPLNGVLGMAQAMAFDDLSDTQRGRLDVIRQSGESLLTILNDILDISKIEAGKLELEEVEFDLGKLVHSVQGTFSAIAAKKNVTVALQLADDVRGVYLGDVTRVRQILHNLVANALKFTEQGGVTIEASKVDQSIRLVVSDSGVGIPADRLPYLFQKFEQADASTTRRYGGTGLGLAICRELAERLGGSIYAESEEGVGTRVILTLCLPHLDTEQATAETAQDQDREHMDASCLRVLAAEDNTVNQLVLKTLLNQVGVDPFIVSDGAEALAAWQEREWDLILMDVQMPVMDGPTAVRRIRQLEARDGRARTPIIALTANAMPNQVAQYIADGMDGLVPKPIEIERLFNAIDAVLMGEEDVVPADDAVRAASC